MVTTKVKPCIIAPSQKYRMIKGKSFRYHLRASTKNGSYLNKPVCRREFISIPITYTELHDAYGAGKLCVFCRESILHM